VKDPKNKARTLWRINVASFALFSLLTVTGLINAYLLPRGFRGQGGGWFSVRHFLVEVHEWTALAFIFTIGIHIFLHWPYIRARLKKEKKTG
jgi:hypothetical protein